MTTLGQLRDICQNALSDASGGTWSDALVEEWISEAVRLYPLQLPEREQITLTADVHYYLLPVLFRQVVAVEYPISQDPPAYLQRKDHRAADFYATSGSYDVDLNYEIAAVPGGEPVDRYLLWLSDNPTTGEKANVEYLAQVDYDLASAAQVKVPQAHFPFVVNYVLWKAFLERFANESKQPLYNSNVLLYLSQNAERVEGVWRRMLNDILQQAAASGFSAAWRADRHDRIY